MLKQIDLGKKLAKADYRRRLPRLQNRLYELQHQLFSQKKVPVAIVFEGWAACGKGRLIGVLSERLDARGFRVVPIRAPRTSEESFPWLHRFWLRIPARGQIVAFDTSWYRRVLVDRVEKRVKKREWQNAYQDITEFEEQLTADGAVVLKFWLHVGQKEQLGRLRALRKSKLTAWQVSKDDLSQNKAYGEYARAVDQMIARTHTEAAPWIVVEATDRHFARVKVFKALIRALEQRLQSAPSPKRKREPPMKSARRKRARRVAHA